jgi:hypothetical protein
MRRDARGLPGGKPAASNVDRIDDATPWAGLPKRHTGRATHNERVDRNEDAQWPAKHETHRPGSVLGRKK